MVYGTIARICRSVPGEAVHGVAASYHLGNGVFGACCADRPFVIASTGNIYAGLYYPIIVAGITFVVGSLLLRETKNTMIWDEVETASSGGSTKADITGPV